MTSRDFCFWLQGFFEIQFDCEPGAAPEGLTPEQTMSIRKHLALVFKHEIDPSMGPPAHQAELNVVHAGLEAAASQPIPPSIQIKLEELKQEFDEKLKALQAKTGWRPPYDGGALRC